MFRPLIFLICATSSAATLEQRLDALLDSGPGKSFIGVQVVALDTGKTLYRRNEDRLFMPASNMKLFTTALALLRLGPDYRFVTRLVQEPSGDLTLVGSGDPSLSGRVYPYTKDSGFGAPLQAIKELADQAVAGGLRRVEGDIVGDDRLYPWAPYPPSWTQDDGLRDYGAPVSALTVNDNVLLLMIRPGATVGDPAVLSLAPPLEYYAIDNRVTTVAKGIEPKLRLSRVPNSRQILLWGSIPVGHAELGETLPVDDPALFAASALYDALVRRGVTVTGRPVARHRSVSDDYDPPEGEELASRRSPPLVQLLQVTDKVSQNLHAELLLREVGRVTRRMGTRDAGLEEMAALVKESGAPLGDVRVEDGSGLARNAVVTPRSVARLLMHLYASKHREAWISLLPVGGEDGTLNHRLCCVSGEGSIHAKTGTLSRAIALSGYAESKAHGWLAFSILVNSFTAPAADVRKWIDKIALDLLQ